MLRRTRRSFVRSAALAALGVVALGACNAPSLPLPPPAALLCAPDATGLVTVNGEALSDAYILCLNDVTERGVIVRANPMGRFSLQIPAEIGQTLSIWQQVGDDLGPPRQFVVPAMDSCRP